MPLPKKVVVSAPPPQVTLPLSFPRIGVYPRFPYPYFPEVEVTSPKFVLGGDTKIKKEISHAMSWAKKVMAMLPILKL